MYLYAAHVCIICTELTGPCEIQIGVLSGLEVSPSAPESWLLARQAGSRGRVGHLHHRSLVVPGSQPVDPAECQVMAQRESSSHTGEPAPLKTGHERKGVSVSLSNTAKGLGNHP